MADSAFFGNGDNYCQPSKIVLYKICICNVNLDKAGETMVEGELKQEITLLSKRNNDKRLLIALTYVIVYAYSKD